MNLPGTSSGLYITGERAELFGDDENSKETCWGTNFGAEDVFRRFLFNWISPADEEGVSDRCVDDVEVLCLVRGVLFTDAGAEVRVLFAGGPEFCEAATGAERFLS